MTPLTHIAVGTAIYERLQHGKWKRWAWSAALLLILLSHFLLDAIPHFEGVYSIRNYKSNLEVLLPPVLIGTLLAVLLWKWSPYAAKIYLILFLWIGLGPYTFSWIRLGSVLFGLGYCALSERYRSSVGYLLAGIVAILPDLLPENFAYLRELHRRAHYHIDWANRIYLTLSHPPVPSSSSARLHNPYFLLGYGLEVLVEAVFFFGAVYLFAREHPARKTPEPETILGPPPLAEVGTTTVGPTA